MFSRWRVISRLTTRTQAKLTGLCRTRVQCANLISRARVRHEQFSRVDGTKRFQTLTRISTHTHAGTLGNRCLADLYYCFCARSRTRSCACVRSTTSTRFHPRRNRAHGRTDARTRTPSPQLVLSNTLHIQRRYVCACVFAVRCDQAPARAFNFTTFFNHIHYESISLDHHLCMHYAHRLSCATTTRQLGHASVSLVSPAGVVHIAGGISTRLTDIAPLAHCHVLRRYYDGRAFDAGAASRRSAPGRDCTRAAAPVAENESI